ncbi:unnamed protein product [Peronospora destructor]|uniref:PDZ domain-containing protein n=1 Tax=Peronospora destructor TaxID=86335 RepID=A0AAV0SWN8_9STRA|nr:unnamed protein product [Peronospora destructor]
MAGEQPQQQTPVTTAIEEHDISFVSSSNGGSSGVQALTPLAFDESLVAALTTACSGTESATSITNRKSAADFSGQIAAVVSDEKKLSSTPRVDDACLVATNVALADFGNVASLSLLGDAMVSGSMSASSDVIARLTTTTTTVTTAVKRELQGVKPGGIGTTATGAVYKKQKTDNVKPELVVKEAAVSVPVSVHPQTQQQQARHHLHINNNPLESTAVATAAAAAAAAAAREKVMKEPQSGDLYECVITKRNGGLGLTLACVDDYVQITGLALNTPAANSGICVGDTLVAVSGLPVRGLQFSTVIGRLKSTSRNSVVLKLRRNLLSSRAEQLQVQLKLEPMNSTYFPTDASILTMGATDLGSSSSNAVPLSIFAPSSSDLSGSQTGWRVNSEEKDRYYAECRALRHELGRSMIAQRIKKRNTATYTSQLQVVVDKFQEQVRSLESASSTAAHASAMEALPVASTTINSDEVAALRQKLVEANQTLAKQQTEILALQEREAQHALPEAQRVKWQLVSNMRQSLLQIDCKAASK